MGNRPVTVALAAAHRSVATGRTGKQHTVKSPDGDIFVETPE